MCGILEYRFLLLLLFVCVSLTIKAGQHTDVSLIQQRQSIVIYVKMRKVRDEVVPHEEAHQNPVIYYLLQVIIGAQMML